MSKLPSYIVSLYNLPLNQKFRIIRMVMLLVYVTIPVRGIQLRFYYWHYLSNTSLPQINRVQLYGDQIRLFKRIITLLPWYVTCLMEGLALHKYMKKHGDLIPVYLGISDGEQLKVHSWSFENHGLANW